MIATMCSNKNAIIKHCNRDLHFYTQNCYAFLYIRETTRTGVRRHKFGELKAVSSKCLRVMENRLNVSLDKGSRAHRIARTLLQFFDSNVEVMGRCNSSQFFESGNIVRCIAFTVTLPAVRKKIHESILCFLFGGPALLQDLTRRLNIQVQYRLCFYIYY